MGTESTVGLELSAGVARLTMNRPARRNAFDDAMWGEFLAAMEEVLHDPAARVLYLLGADGNFTAGADVQVLEAGAEGPAASEGPHPFSRVMDHLTETFDKPIVAAVDGFAVGFGLTVLLHCDFVYVSARARLRAPFIRLGLAPEAGSSFLLPEILGVRRAAELLFATDFIDGARAVELGLANACVPAEELESTAWEKARLIAGNAPQAMRATKRLLLDGRRDAVRAAIARENEAFGHLMGSPENLEALQAFREKRAPDFSRIQHGDGKKR